MPELQVASSRKRVRPTREIRKHNPLVELWVNMSHLADCAQLSSHIFIVIELELEERSITAPIASLPIIVSPGALDTKIAARVSLARTLLGALFISLQAFCSASCCHRSGTGFSTETLAIAALKARCASQPQIILAI